MNKLLHLLLCQGFANDEETKARMTNNYLCGLDPFVTTGEGIPNFDKKNPYSLLNCDEQFFDNGQTGPFEF